MKKNESLMSIPVVMITTEGSNQRVEEFLDKGAVAYIKKPFSPEEIKQKLNRIMGETSDEDEQEGFDVGDEELDF
jgi:two-component system chemotaxis response regulator CheY